MLDHRAPVRPTKRFHSLWSGNEPAVLEPANARLGLTDALASFYTGKSRSLPQLSQRRRQLVLFTPPARHLLCSAMLHGGIRDVAATIA
jgi:hypothetical protein